MKLAIIRCTVESFETLNDLIVFNNYSIIEKGEYVCITRSCVYWLEEYDEYNQIEVAQIITSTGFVRYIHAYDLKFILVSLLN